MYLPSQVTNVTEKIGDTLFINGVPYTECGICGMIIKKFDGNRTTIAHRGKQHVEVRAYKVLKGKWIRVTDSIGVDCHGVELLESKMKPIVKSVPACIECWNKFEDMKAAMPGHIRFFGDGKDEV